MFTAQLCAYGQRVHVSQLPTVLTTGTPSLTKYLSIYRALGTATGAGTHMSKTDHMALPLWNLYSSGGHPLQMIPEVKVCKEVANTSHYKQKDLLHMWYPKVPF